MRTVLLALAALAVGHTLQPAGPPPPGRLVDIGGGQRIHLNCTGAGSPAVVFESGAGDFSFIWSLVQPEVSRFTRSCSYDRAGYVWSDPGAVPRTFSQLALELRTVLQKAHEPGPYVLVGQSCGGSLVRGYAARYPGDVAGLVLIDAVHEDGYVTYGGRAHHLRDEHKERVEPAPRIALNEEVLRESKTVPSQAPAELPPPLNRLPAAAQKMWMWAAAQPVYRIAQPLEMDWSPDEAERQFQRRRRERATLGSLPLIVLARTKGGYHDGMNIFASGLEELRRSQQADLAALSSRGVLRFAPDSGHNIHVEDPAFTVQAVRDAVEQVRHRP